MKYLMPIALPPLPRLPPCGEISSTGFHRGRLKASTMAEGGPVGRIYGLRHRRPDAP